MVHEVPQKPSSMAEKGRRSSTSLGVSSVRKGSSFVTDQEFTTLSSSNNRKVKMFLKSTASLQFLKVIVYLLILKNFVEN